MAEPLARPGGPTSPSGSPLPPQVTMGLLPYITAYSLDEDYAHAAARGERTAGQQRPPTRPGRAAVLVLLVFGLLVATAAVQTSRTAGARQNSQAGLVDQVNAGRADLDAARDRLATAETELAAVERANRAAATNEAAAVRLADRLGLVVGSVPVRGPGLRMLVDDAADVVDESQLVFDRDLQDIANGLWDAGAEAISINGQRLTTTSAIRFAGGFINVNDEPVVAPYVVLAIGDPDTLPSRFVETTSGTRWLSTRETLDLQFEMTSEENVTIPAAPPSRLLLQVATNPATEVEGNS